MYFEALAQVNLALDSFVHFEPIVAALDLTDANINDETAAEDAKEQSILMQEIETLPVYSSPLNKSQATKKRVSICLDHEIIELQTEPNVRCHH